MNYYIFNSSWYVAGVLCGSHLVPMMIIVIIYVNTNPLYGWGHWGLEELRVVPKVHSQEVAELRLKPTFLSQHLTCFPDSSAGKESACNARDLGSIPGSARSPQEGNGSPLQYSCLENSMDRGAWQVQSMGSQSWTQLSDWTELNWLTLEKKWALDMEAEVSHCSKMKECLWNKFKKYQLFGSRSEMIHCNNYLLRSYLCTVLF